jgi:DNA sulfur modification protein DndD
MIFEELTIHNFGIYKGRHQITLTPSSPKKPIILFGGLNGGGKTTFLDALQLVLYGKFARCSNRGSLAYDDYLRETINRHCPTKEGAALELKFSHYVDGLPHTYEIKRFWHSTGKAIKEDMEVIHNGVLDPVMTEQWYEYVDEFIPLSISSLFFFDGEKIEALADPSGSAGLLRTGITSLLGLDIIDKLGTDLNALLRTGVSDTKKAKLNPKEQASNAKLKDELLELKTHSKALKRHHAETETTVDVAKNVLHSLKSEYRAVGGELFEQREIMIEKLKSIQANIGYKEAELRKLAEGYSPLSLVEDLLWQSLNQASAESTGRDTKQFLDKLTKRDKDLIHYLVKTGAEEKTINLLKKKLESENNALEKKIPKDFHLNTPTEAYSGLSLELFSKLKENSKKIVQELEILEEQRLNAERNLSTVPQQASIADLQNKLAERELALVKDQAKLSILQDQLALAERQIQHTEQKLSNLNLVDAKNNFDAELDRNIVNNIGNMQTVLEKFHSAMVEKHIRHLESLIYESFKSLIRKPKLVKRISIEPETYKITLFDQQIEPIPSNRLSAGERQILAISILWGLAKASGRPLPAIIDTPLGRLDSEHRKQLVDKYFPNASHQVILLSTDQEIDQNYRNDLSKYIGREYHIEYQESLQTSTITEGYF